jgi:hypothetical protein
MDVVVVDRDMDTPSKVDVRELEALEITMIAWLAHWNLRESLG